MPAGLEPTTLHGFAAAIPDVQPSADTSADSDRLGGDQGDVVEQPVQRDLDLRAEPKETPDTAGSPANETKASGDDPSALTSGSGHFTHRHYRRRKEEEETAPEIATNEDQTGDAVKPARPRVAKPTGASAEPRIQSLDPNWWVVPSH